MLQKKEKEEWGKKKKNLSGWCNGVLGAFLTSVRSGQENAAIYDPAYSKDPGDRGVAAAAMAPGVTSGKGGVREGERAPLASRAGV